MKRFVISLGAALSFSSAGLPAQQPAGRMPLDSLQQIAAAVLPLPAELRAGAAVVAFTPDAPRPRTLRAGTNGLVCFAVPSTELFDVRCYARSFLPLLLRLRQLRAVPEAEVARTIAADVRAHRLTLPSAPTAGYRMLGPMSGYDAATNTVSDTIDVWQSIHTPYATAAAIGVPTEPGDWSRPFMMASGTFWSHLMIMQRPLHY